WVPELAHLDDKMIHTPWLAKVSHDIYPAPIVDHMQSMREAKEKIYGARRDQAAREEAKRVYEKHGSRNPARDSQTRTLKRVSTARPSLQASLFETES
ncbi:MAG: FAD-binding domain-containing protein, partial [Casimicrobium sp.]